MKTPSTNLREENQVLLFPSVAGRDADGEGWRIHVQGEVFTRGRIGLTKRILLRLLQRVLKASNEAMRGELFQRRIERFLAQDEGGKRVSVRIGNDVFPLPGKTTTNGHFAATLRVPGELVEQHRAATGPGAERLFMDVFREPGERPDSDGEVFLLESTGTSVISDIDDTIKHSFVACRRTLLQNTFLKEFEAIGGMSAVYRRWAEAGADFHYVSSSPWQLYEHLRELLVAGEFPAGSFHLRPFRLRDHLLRRLLMLRRTGKANVIASLLRMFPERRFYFVGDSGESDPETYGAIARRYPRQVAGVFIRTLNGPRDTTRRFENAFRQLPPDLWRTFQTAEELPGELSPVPSAPGRPR